MRYDIVIAGGGFAGAYCARELGRVGPRLKRAPRVAIVAERNVLVFQPMLAEVVGSTLGAMDVVNPLRQFCRGVDVFQAAIHRIDWPKRELILNGGRFTRDQAMGFEHLVLAVGSVTNLSHVPGMAEYGWPMKGVADALRLRAALINRLEEANLVPDVPVRARLLTFVVVGGGYTGVELAGQIFDFLREARRFYPALRDTPLRVVLAHAGDQLMAEIGPELGAYAQRILARRGIEIRLKTKVVEVTAIRVHFDGGEAIDAHTVISTIGNAPHPLVTDLIGQLGMKAPKGRLETEPTMRVAGQPNLWAMGDCASVPWDDRGQVKASPPTAQFATRQGRQLGRNLARVLDGGSPRPFQYRYLGQMATIGAHEAVAEIMGLHFRGFIAWWLWRTIYLAKLPGLRRKLRVMIDWTFELVFPRDISVLLPPADEVIRSIHLEKGEVLFSSGDAARSLFYVHRGALELIAAGQAARTVGVGGVVDQGDLDSAGRWALTATAAESTDLVVFRGRAFELMRGSLRLTPIIKR